MALNDVLGYAFDADGILTFQAREGSRLAAIVQSLVAEPYQVAHGRWSALANRDPVSARYVIEQLALATKDDISARLDVVGMDEIALFLLAPTPEAPHAP